jgi:hypothetical protein
MKIVMQNSASKEVKDINKKDIQMSEMRSNVPSQMNVSESGKEVNPHKTTKKI